MVTLLKAYLIGTHDPFQLTNIFIDELKKDLQAAEESMIGGVYDLQEWKKDIKEIKERIQELDGHIDTEKDMIIDRNETYQLAEKGLSDSGVAGRTLELLYGKSSEKRKHLDKQLQDERIVSPAGIPDMSDTASWSHSFKMYIKKLTIASKKQASKKDLATKKRKLSALKTTITQQDKDSRNSIKRYQRYKKLDNEELAFYNKWYTEVMGFEEGTFDEQENKKIKEILEKGKEFLNAQIEETRQTLQSEGTKQDMKDELKTFNEQTTGMEYVTEEIKEKQRKDIRSKYRKAENHNLRVKIKIDRLKNRYIETIQSIENLKDPKKESVKSADQINREVMELEQQHRIRAQRLAWELAGMSAVEFDDRYKQFKESRGTLHPMEEKYNFRLKKPYGDPKEMVAMVQLITGYMNPFRNINRNWSGFYARNIKGELFIYDEEEKHTDGKLGAFVETDDPPKSVQESRAKSLEEKKKIWLEGGYPSWGKFQSSSKTGKRYLSGVNDEATRRGLEKITISNKIKSAYKDKNMSLKEFKAFILKTYPAVFVDKKKKKGGGVASAVAGNWAEWEQYEEGLAHVLRNKEDKYGQKLLDKLRKFMNSLSEKELQQFQQPVAESTSTSHGLINQDGDMESKKKRLKNLKSLLDVYTSALEKLTLESSQMSAAHYIMDRIKEHIGRYSAISSKDAPQDLSVEHQKELEFWHDLYNEALNIREHLPPSDDYEGDEFKEYQREQIIEVLSEIQEILKGLESDEEPSEEDYFLLLVKFELLNREIDVLEIPSWAPKKEQIEKAIEELEKKLEKFYGQMSNVDIKRFKEVMDKAKIKEPRLTRPKPKKRKKKFSTERREIIELYVRALEQVRVKLRKKYVNLTDAMWKENDAAIRKLLGFYFPKFIVKIPDAKQKSRKKPLSQTAVNTHRTRLIDNIWRGNKINLNDYPHLYDFRVDVAGHEIKTHIKQGKLDEDTGRETMYGAFDEELVGNVQQAINADDDNILDDDEVEDLEDLAEQESTLSERFEGKIKDKEGKQRRLSVKEMEELLQEEQDEKEESAREQEKKPEDEKDSKEVTSDIKKPPHKIPKKIELDRDYIADQERRERDEPAERTTRRRKKDMERLQEHGRKLREEEE